MVRDPASVAERSPRGTGVLTSFNTWTGSNLVDLGRARCVPPHMALGGNFLGGSLILPGRPWGMPAAYPWRQSLPGSSHQRLRDRPVSEGWAGLHSPAGQHHHAACRCPLRKFATKCRLADSCIAGDDYHASGTALSAVQRSRQHPQLLVTANEDRTTYRFHPPRHYS